MPAHTPASRCAFIPDMPSRIVSLLLPQSCPICGGITGGDVLCPRCLLALPRLPLYGSAATTVLSALENAVCPVGLIAAWIQYDAASPVAEMIRTAKYRSRPAMARRLGQLFAEELKERSAAAHMPDVLVPVPMHWRKELRRGYNQASLIARGIADVLGIEVADNLRAVAPHATQTHRSAEERRRNIEGIFGVEHPNDFDDLDIAIVDDVITTGATVGEAALALGRAGARPSSLGILALAMACR